MTIGLLASVLAATAAPVAPEPIPASSVRPVFVLSSVTVPAPKSQLPSGYALTVAAAAPKGPLTLAQRVDILFGNKPEAAVPAATVAPVTAAPATTPAPAVAPAATAPVVEAAPTAPAADPKGAEKGKDLDRKINQLFK